LQAVLAVGYNWRGGRVRTRISIEKVRGEFVQQVEEISGQDLLACNQCGKCSAGCPVVAEMDILPSQAIRLAQLGMEEEVLASATIWMCASCLTCVARCPKGVDLPRLCEALRQIALRQGIAKLDPSELPLKLIREVPQLAIVAAFRKYIR
jgi:heterodisulfide reductase subunit C